MADVGWPADHLGVESPLKYFLLAALLLVLTVACSPRIPENTGIEGHVLIGPVCPVEQLNNPCPYKPYQATLSVLDANRRKVVTFQTDANGYFHEALNPGTYILHPETPGVMPIAPDQTFSVLLGQNTRLTITYDSGIR
jgi:hypothetical protein